MFLLLGLWNSVKYEEVPLPVKYLKCYRNTLFISRWNPCPGNAAVRRSPVMIGNNVSLSNGILFYCYYMTTSEGTF
jgi:hypothetical protein